MLLETTAVEREPGPPQTESFSFAAPAEGWICISVENDGIAAARIDLDGAPLLGPERFRPVVHVIDEVAPVAAGDHELTARLASGPANALTITVRFTPLDPAPQNVVAGAAGRIEAYNLFDTPDPFSPNGDGVKDQTSLSVDVRVVRTDGLTPPHSPNTFRLHYALEIASAETCEELRRIAGTVVLDPSMIGTGAGATSHIVAPIAEAWDGRDDAGALVPDGRYFYRYAIDYEKEMPSGNVHLLDSVLTPIADITIDTAPPEILLLSPEMTVSDSFDPVFTMRGLVSPPGDVASLILFITSTLGTRSLGVPFDGEGRFDEEVSLDVPGNPRGDRNDLLLLAWDDAGNSAQHPFTRHFFPEYVTDTLGVGFIDSVGAAERNSIISSFGAAEYVYLPSINFSWIQLAAGVTVEEAEAYFGALPGVEYTDRNYIYTSDQVYPPDEIFDAYYTPDHLALAIIRAPWAWEQVTGDTTASVIVAVIDSGIDFTHPDLAPNMWINPAEDNGDGVFTAADIDGVDDDVPHNNKVDDVVGYDFSPEVWDGGGDSTHFLSAPTDVGTDPIPLDYRSHGTAVAGIVGAHGGDVGPGGGTAGVNWRVKIMALRAGIRNTTGLYADAIDPAFEYAVANGARVVNMSFSGPKRRGFERSICQAYADGGPAGVLVVAAAGNAGKDIDGWPPAARFPAGYECPNIISVAATFRDEFTLASYSNYGKGSVDVAAPSESRTDEEPFAPVAYITTMPTYDLSGDLDCSRFPTANCRREDASGNILPTGGWDQLDPNRENRYGEFGGTSGAAPQVAGEAGLILSTDPAMPLNNLIGIILGAVDRSPELEDKVKTAGRINLEKAIAAALAGPPSINRLFDISETIFDNEDASDVAFAPLVVSPAGTRFAVSGEDDRLHLFDSALTGHYDIPLISISIGSDTRAVAFNHSGQMLAVGNDAGEVMVFSADGLLDGAYDPATDLLYTYSVGHKVNDLVFSDEVAHLQVPPAPDYWDYFLAVAADDRTLVVIPERVIDGTAPWMAEKVLHEGGGPESYEAVSVSASAEYLVVGSDENRFMVYLTTDCYTVDNHIESSDFGDDVDAVAYDPTDTGAEPRFAVGNDSPDGGAIRMCVASIVGGVGSYGCSAPTELTDDAQGIAWAPNGSMLVVGTEDEMASGMMVLPDWSLHQIFTTGPEIRNTMTSVAVSPSGMFFVVAGDNEAGVDWYNVHGYSMDPPQL